MARFCPHGYKWGNGDGLMHMDHASDGCDYHVDEETARVREQADVIRRLFRGLEEALRDRDTHLAKDLLAQIREAAEP